jgi:hypothetical protein
MKRLNEQELEVLYKTNYSSKELIEMRKKFCEIYNIELKDFDPRRFIKFNDKDIAEIDKLARGRYKNNRKSGVKQSDSGCGEAISYLERDFPGIFGEKAYAKYLEKYSKKTLTDINSIELSSKENGTDQGDFIVDGQKIEVKTNQLDTNHKYQKTCNLMIKQFEHFRSKKNDVIFCQVIMLSNKMAYISGYTTWYNMRENCRFPQGRSKYYAVPYKEVMYTSFDKLPDLVDFMFSEYI